MMDHPAITLREKVLSNVSHRQGAETVYEIDIDDPAPDCGSKVVEAHLDLDMDGEISVGDLVHAESSPLFSRAPACLSLKLTRVK